MAVLERVAERLLRLSFVDLGTGTLGSSMYLLSFLMWYPSFIYMRVKTICSRIQNCDWLVLFLTFAMNTTQVSFESLFPRQLSATNRTFLVRSILVDYFYIE